MCKGHGALPPPGSLASRDDVAGKLRRIDVRQSLRAHIHDALVWCRKSKFSCTYRRGKEAQCSKSHPACSTEYLTPICVKWKSDYGAVNRRSNHGERQKYGVGIREKGRVQSRDELLVVQKLCVGSVFREVISNGDRLPQLSRALIEE